MHKKKALICGISGQDGAYLARLLPDKGCEVYSRKRRVPACPVGRSGILLRKDSGRSDRHKAIT